MRPFAGLATGSALLAACALLVACEEKKDEPTAPRSRSQSVVAKPGASPKPAASATVEKAQPEAPRELCEGQLGKPGRDFPSDQDVSSAAAPGAALPPKAIPTSGGEWTWINFWAAWCAPCKAEMPRLLRWERELRQAKNPFRLVFVSVDDDERQLRKFLSGQPRDGVRATYWLREGDERTSFLEAAGAEEDPELPFHVLVGPKGKIRCIVQGAVEDSDYGQVAALVSAE